MVTIIKAHANSPVKRGEKFVLQITYKGGGKAQLIVEPAADLTLRTVPDGKQEATLPSSDVERTVPVEVVIEPASTSLRLAEIIVEAPPTDPPSSDNCQVFLE